MTFKEFRLRVLAISREQFTGTKTHPLEHGIERATFEEQKLERLIAAARGATFITAKRRVAAWRRQLQKVRAARQRLMAIKAGVYPGERKSRRIADHLALANNTLVLDTTSSDRHMSPPIT